jgi:hypothetical protein
MMGFDSNDKGPLAEAMELAAHENQLLRTALGDMVDAMSKWAAEEDGIHPDAWKAYVNAHGALRWALTQEPADGRKDNG